MKVIEINDSAKAMKLNVDNRVKFMDIILSDVLLARSTKVRQEMGLLIGKFTELTYGATPQRRAAVKKRMDKLEADGKELAGMGIVTNTNTGTSSNSININLAGSAITLYFWDEFLGKHTLDFTEEFMQYRRHHSSENKTSIRLGTNNIIIKHGDPLIKTFWDLKHEGEAISEASQELTAVLSTVFGKSKTLGQALEKWPELSQYVPAIMSSSKEIVVPVGTLNKRLDTLRSGKGKVSDAMKVEE